MELITFCSNAVRVVNERPLKALSDDPRDFAVVTPASLLTPAFDPYIPVGRAHDWDHLRRDYKFNVAVADRFWKDWVAFYLPTLQGRNKWRETSKNLQIGDLVLVGDSVDISERGKHRVGRVAEVFPKCIMKILLFGEPKMLWLNMILKRTLKKWSIYTVTSHVLHLFSRPIPTIKFTLKSMKPDCFRNLIMFCILCLCDVYSVLFVVLFVLCE